jgi:hypothetical protein
LSRRLDDLELLIEAQRIDHHCAVCGLLLVRKRRNRLESMNVFLRRKFCDRRCMAVAMIKDEVGDAALHLRARCLCGSSCERCGTTDKLSVHHIDGDPSNNDPSNLMTLCGSCHTKWHWEHGKQKRESPPCIVCGEKSRKLQMCQKHYLRWKNYGDALLTKRVLLGSKHPKMIRVNLADELVAVIDAS